MKCIKCKQMFIKDVENVSKTKKVIMDRTCRNCRILPARRSFKENKK